MRPRCTGGRPPGPLKGEKGAGAIPLPGDALLREGGAFSAFRTLTQLGASAKHPSPLPGGRGQSARASRGGRGGDTSLRRCAVEGRGAIRARFARRRGGTSLRRCAVEGEGALSRHFGPSPSLAQAPSIPLPFQGGGGNPRALRGGGGIPLSGDALLRGGGALSAFRTLTQLGASAKHPSPLPGGRGERPALRAGRLGNSPVCRDGGSFGGRLWGKGGSGGLRPIIWLGSGRLSGRASKVTGQIPARNVAEGIALSHWAG